MTSYDDIPYHYAAFKASHNSYDKAEDLATQLSWDPTTPSRFGCRGLELDLHQDGNSNRWSVSHTGGYDPAPARQLASYLGNLRAWSEASPAHDPVTVHLDLKGAGQVASGADLLDRYIDDALGSGRLFRPGDLLGAGTDLVAAASKGWPTLGEMRGRFLLCLTGKESWKRQYSERQPRVRLSFADLELDADSSAPNPTTGSRVFLNLHYAPPLTLKPALKWIRENQAFVSRVYRINSQTAWAHVQPPGANIIATDTLTGGAWAAVGSEPFASTLVEHAGV